MSRLSNRFNRRDRRSLKYIESGNRTLATMPWKTAAVFEKMDEILAAMEATGDIDAENGIPVFKVPKSHAWFELAPAIEGFAEVYECHARISGREMPTAALRQLANKFKYGVMIFPSDVDQVRTSLETLRAETMSMTLNYADALIQTVKEAA